MKVLVTGANGFIGSYLVRDLKKAAYDVVAHNHNDGDLCEKGILDKYKDISVIFHLAGYTYVPYSWETPDLFINCNVCMTTNVLEFCRKNGCKLIFLSSYMYGTPKYLPIDESHQIEVVSPYHLSKKLCEDICHCYSDQFNVDVMIFRPFNVYGKGQNDSFLLPKIFNQIQSEKDMIELYDLAPKRDYIYVEDLSDVLVKMIPYVTGFEIFNIGSGESYSVSEAVGIMQKVLGTNKPVIETGNVRKNEISDCASDNTKLLQYLHEIRFKTLEEGIRLWAEF